MGGASDESGVTADTLFLGITRPALALGVPYAALLVNGLVTLELFLTTRNLLCLLICVPLHGLSWLACLAEPRFFEILSVWVQVRVRGGFRESRAWRARSYGCLRGPSRRGAESFAAVVEHSDSGTP